MLFILFSLEDVFLSNGVEFLVAMVPLNQKGLTSYIHVTA